MDVGIGGDGAAHVYAYRRGVYELDLAHTFGLEAEDVLRQGAAVNLGLKRRHQALKYERRLARAGDAGDNGQPAARYIHLQRLYRVYRACGEAYPAQLKERAARCRRAERPVVNSGQEGADA